MQTIGVVILILIAACVPLKMRLIRSTRVLPLWLAFAALAFGQGGRGGLVSLKQVPIPQPTNLATYVKDQAALIALGKVLFWDVQVGSDGKVAQGQDDGDVFAPAPAIVGEGPAG
jgi:hypothetical protein